MKFFLVLIAFIFFSEVVKAQPSFSVFIAAPDTSPSIFSQNLCPVWLSKIPTIDEEYTPAFTVAANTDTSYLAVKFPNFDWLMLRERKSLKGVIGINPIVGIIDNMNDNTYINLLALYDEIPELFESAKNGTTVLIRYQMYTSINNDSFHYIYSNIDTLYLPAATSEDIAGFEYLENHIKNIRRFSYLFNDEGATLDVCQYIISNFPGSLISDLAKFRKMDIDLLTVQSSNLSLSNADLVDFLKAQYEVLKTSKSELVQSRAKRW